MESSDNSRPVRPAEPDPDEVDKVEPDLTNVYGQPLHLSKISAAVSRARREAREPMPDREVSTPPAPPVRNPEPEPPIYSPLPPTSYDPSALQASGSRSGRWILAAFFVVLIGGGILAAFVLLPPGGLTEVTQGPDAPASEAAAETPDTVPSEPRQPDGREALTIIGNAPPIPRAPILRAPDLFGMRSAGNAPDKATGVQPVAFPAPNAAPPQIDGAVPDPVDSSPPVARSGRVMIRYAQGLATSALDGLLANLARTELSANTPAAVSFRISKTNARYFHPSDQVLAEKLQSDLGGPGAVSVRVFTGYSPKPAPGTIELWVSNGFSPQN